jgi:uncharacterized membrane-anchored protein
MSRSRQPQVDAARRSQQLRRAGEHASGLLSCRGRVTAIFWLTKVLTTGVGESTSDFLVKQVGKGGAVFLGTIAFAAALIWQFKTSRYTPGVYWLAVAMVAVFGTLAADAVHVGLGVPYYASSTLYAVILAGIFVAWYRTEGTLSIHSIYTPRREVFYWLAVLATFALGTAVGDLTARSFGWGYLSSAVVFGCAIAVPAIAYWRTNLNPILIFWTAYVLTRPLGASLADWLGKNHDIGGLGLGDGTVSVAGALFIVGLVSYLARNQRAISPDLRPQPQE